MEGITNLKTWSTKADILEGFLFEKGMDPIGKNSLIRFAELTGTSQNPRAVDPDGKIKRFTVLKYQGLGREFGGSVKRDGGGCGEGFGNPLAWDSFFEIIFLKKIATFSKLENFLQIWKSEMQIFEKLGDFSQK